MKKGAVLIYHTYQHIEMDICYWSFIEGKCKKSNLEAK